MNLLLINKLRHRIELFEHAIELDRDAKNFSVCIPRTVCMSHTYIHTYIHIYIHTYKNNFIAIPFPHMTDLQVLTIHTNIQ